MKTYFASLALLLAVLTTGLTSCTSEKNPDERSISRGPASVVAVDQEASVIIKDYGQKLSQIDVGKTSANMETKAERDEFARYMQHLKGAYDQAVVQLEKFNQAVAEDKELRRQELEDTLNQLEMSWDDFARNYRL